MLQTRAAARRSTQDNASEIKEETGSKAKLGRDGMGPEEDSDEPIVVKEKVVKKRRTRTDKEVIVLD